jgi:hypothetical protein
MTIRYEFRDRQFRAWPKARKDLVGVGPTRAEAIYSLLALHGNFLGIYLSGTNTVESTAAEVRDLAARASVSPEEFARRFDGPEGDAAADAMRSRDGR